MAGFTVKTRMETEERNERPLRYGTGQEDTNGIRFDAVNDPGKGYSQAARLQVDAFGNGGSFCQLAQLFDDRQR